MSRGAPRPRHVLWPSGDRPDSPRASARPSRTRSERAEEFLLHGAVSRDRRAGVVGTAVERGPVASAPCGRSIEHVICLPVSTPVTPTRPLGRREGGQARRVRDERPTRDRSVPSGPAPVTSARQRTLECAGRPGSGELGDAPAALRARLRRRGHESGRSREAVVFGRRRDPYSTFVAGIEPSGSRVERRPGRSTTSSGQGGPRGPSGAPSGTGRRCTRSPAALLPHSRSASPASSERERRATAGPVGGLVGRCSAPIGGTPTCLGG